MMAAVFFAAVGVAYHRHRTRSRAALHAALAEQRAAVEAARREDPAPRPGADPAHPDAVRYRSITNPGRADGGAPLEDGGRTSPEGRGERGTSGGAG
jgi:hypothetical protein